PILVLFLRFPVVYTGIRKRIPRYVGVLHARFRLKWLKYQGGSINRIGSLTVEGKEALVQSLADEVTTYLHLRNCYMYIVLVFCSSLPEANGTIIIPSGTFNFGFGGIEAYQTSNWILGHTPKAEKDLNEMMKELCPVI
ncbi:hypothetical protein MKW98_025344, partial [Papaver atlanticum]